MAFGDDATPLHFAAWLGVPETVRVLIDSGVDIFATTAGGQQTAVEVAARFGRTGTAVAILNDPRFDQGDQDVRQALLDKCLWLAASAHPRSKDRPELVQALLTKGANPNVTERSVSAVQAVARRINLDDEKAGDASKEVVALLVKHGATLDLFSALAIGDEGEAARLLEQDPASANVRGPNGYPALHCAVSMNYQEIVKKLLQVGGDPDIRNNSLDMTPLHYAAFGGRYEIAKLLIDAGADVNALSKGQTTPLHNAARMARVRVTRLLLEEGAKIDAKDDGGDTPLDCCPWNAHEVRRILEEYRVKNNK